MKADVTDKINKIFQIFIILIILIYTLVNLISYVNFANKFDSIDEVETCSSFFPGVNETRFENKNDVSIKKTDIYVLPEIENIYCLGKIVNFEKNPDEVFFTVGSNTKFINFVIFLSMVSIFILYYFFFNKVNYKFLNVGLTLFFTINFYHSLNSISYFLIIFPSLIFYYLENNKKQNKKEKYELNSRVKFKHIGVLMTLFVIIQASSHNFETLDWDINSFIVSAMDIGRGNLPLENQFETKQPLLFIIYFLFTKLSFGNLIVIKLLNDLMLFLNCILIYKIIGTNKNNKNNLDAFVASLIFVLFTSNYWYHPGYSEIYSIFFIASSYLLIVKPNITKLNLLISGVLFSFSTMVNIGSILFIFPLLISIYSRQKKKLKNLVFYIYGFTFSHFFLFLIYLFSGLLNTYLISFIKIPLSYANSEFNLLNEIQVFSESFLNYNLLIFIILILCFSITISRVISNYLIERKIFIDSDLELLLFLITSFIFYYSAGKGYYHHLLFALFFLSFGAKEIPTKKFKIVIYFILFISSVQVVLNFLPHSTNNLRNLNNIENNYPVKEVSKNLSRYLDKEDRVFSTNNILILYYLNKPNSSYIVHPSLYEYKEITKVLTENNKINKDEISYQLSLKPKLIEGLDSHLISNEYKEIRFQNIRKELINYWEKENQILIHFKDS